MSTSEIILRMRMESKLSILLTFCTIFCIHYNIPTANALVGPTVRDADLFEILYVVSFLKNNPPYTNPLESHFCTGTLVTRDCVLSSAHCTTYNRYNDTVILAGTSNLNYGHLYSVEWWINYAEWARERNRNYQIFFNDISITKLDREVENYIPVAMLSPIQSQLLPDREAKIISWGVGNNGHVSANLKIGDVKFISKGECEYIISNVDEGPITLDSRLLCTIADPYIVMMVGDFGGPVMIGNYLVGVNKETRPFTNEQFDSRKVNIHTNINHYRPFFNAVLSPDFFWITY